jgi:hypothetical protein
MGSNESGYPEDRLEPTADGKFGNEDLLAQVLRPDLSDGEKVRLLKENMPTESMTPGREAAMIWLLDRLGRVVEGNDRQAGIGEVAEMLRGFAPQVFEPTRPEPPPRVPAGTRATVLLEFLRATHAALVDELAGMRLNTDAEAAAYELIGAVKTARDSVLAAGPSDLGGIEAEVLRPLAQDAREFALRRHLTFARPIWPSTKVPRDAGTVFYSGGERVRGLIEQACADRGLRCLPPVRHREPASGRWEQLRMSAVAVFDLTALAAPSPTADIVAPVAYELGMALAVGCPVVIVATGSQRLPFDVDVDPVRVRSTDDRADGQALADGLDSAIYGLLRGGVGDSVGSSLAWLRWHYRDLERWPQVLDVFDPSAAEDSVRARRLAMSALSLLNDDLTEMVLPSWPGSYPDPAEPRCFHVTAFGPDWATMTREVLAAACAPEWLSRSTTVDESVSRPIAYIRGDESHAPDIIRAIWDDISRATHVVVDLTGLNPNVVLELGIGHVLGRNVLLISQDPPEGTFPAIAKLRCYQYSLTGPGRAELRDIFDRFLFPDQPTEPSGRDGAARAPIVREGWAGF